MRHLENYEITFSGQLFIRFFEPRIFQFFDIIFLTRKTRSTKTPNCHHRIKNYCISTKILSANNQKQLLLHKKPDLFSIYFLVSHRDLAFHSFSLTALDCIPNNHLVKKRLEHLKLYEIKKHNGHILRH